jgi:hypothetical protein
MNRADQWPQERILQLRELWARDGFAKLTIEEIAQHLGVSPSAAAGKAYRLELTRRRSPVRRYCCWIVGKTWHNGRSRLQYCDASTLPGRPYCQEHDGSPIPTEPVRAPDVLHWDWSGGS